MSVHVTHIASTMPVEAAGADSRLVETRVLRRCAQYRKAFRESAVSYPADALQLHPVAQWIRGHGVTVDVRSAQAFRQASAARILAPQIVVYCAGMAMPLLHCAVNIGVGRFVVDSVEQVTALATAMGRMRQVVVDVAAPDPEQLVAKVVESRRLSLIGLHRRLDDDCGTAADVVREMTQDMSRLRRVHPQILTRISLTNVDAGVAVERYALRRYAEVIEDAAEDACIWFRYPRPALTVAPSRASLLLGM